MRISDWSSDVCSSDLPLLQLLREVLEDRHQGIGRRLAEAADRGVAHDLRQLLEQRRVPGLLAHQLHRLLGAVAAGRALAAGLVLAEAHEVEGRGRQVILVGEYYTGVQLGRAAGRVK